LCPDNQYLFIASDLACYTVVPISDGHTFSNEKVSL